MRMKCLHCQNPNSPQCFDNISSMPRDSADGFIGGGIRGEWRSGGDSNDIVLKCVLLEDCYLS